MVQEVSRKMSAWPELSAPGEDMIVLVTADVDTDDAATYRVPVDFLLSGMANVVGDGVTNDYAGLQAAITARAGKVLDLGGRTYKCNSPLLLSNGITLQNGTLDFTGLTSGATALSATGTLGSSKTLTADFTYATRAITIASTTGMAAGDWILCDSTALWGTTSSGIIGEITRIKTVDSATGITTETPAHSTYATAAAGKFKKLNLEYQNIKLKDLRVIGAGVGAAQQGAVFTHCFGITIENCHFEDFDSWLVEFYGCVKCRVTNSEFRESRETGVAYGVLIQRGCRDVGVEGCHFSYMRHGVTVGGSAWVNRFIRVENCHVDYCVDAGLDCHTNAQYVIFDGNTVSCSDFADISAATDGIIVQCADFIVSNNIVRRPLQSGIWWQNYVEGHPGYPSGQIIGNEIIEPGTQGIYVQNVGQHLKGLVISDNVVRGVRGTGTGGIYVFADTFNILRAVVSNNAVTECTNHGIHIRGSTGALTDCTVSSNQVEVTNAAGAVDGIRLLTCTRVSVTGNAIEIANTARSGILSSDATKCVIANNEILMAAASTGSCINLGGTGEGFVIQGNRGVNGANGLLLASTITSSKLGINDFAGCTVELSRSSGTGHTVALMDGLDAISTNDDLNLPDVTWPRHRRVYVDCEHANWSDAADKVTLPATPIVGEMVTVAAVGDASVAGNNVIIDSPDTIRGNVTINTAAGSRTYYAMTATVWQLVATS